MSQHPDEKSRPVTVDIPRILEILPHRYPFVLVDRITNLVPGQYVVGHKMVSYNEPWVTGHFPEQPVFPGVLIIEALAQIGAVLAYATDPFDASRSRMFFLGVDKVKFRNTVTPGDKLDLRVEAMDHRSNVWKLRGEATVDGTLCAQGELLASIVDRNA